jgi:hypothetical protein
MPLRAPDFESGASANSATSARSRLNYTGRQIGRKAGCTGPGASQGVSEKGWHGQAPACRGAAMFLGGAILVTTAAQVSLETGCILHRKKGRMGDSPRLAATTLTLPRNRGRPVRWSASVGLARPFARSRVMRLIGL